MAPSASPRPRGGRGRSKRLDRAKIVAAALELAREGGTAALSMRRVAGRLDVDVAALYWHFRNKEELLAEVAEAAAARVDLAPPSTGSWDDRVFALCRALLEQLRAHPELGLQAGASPWTTPFNARANGLLVELLAEGGLQGEQLLLAAQALLHQVTALAQSERLGLGSGPDGVRGFVRSVAEHLPDRLQGEWRTLARAPVEQSFDALFELSVRALLVGFSAAAGSRGGEST